MKPTRKHLSFLGLFTLLGLLTSLLAPPPAWAPPGKGARPQPIRPGQRPVAGKKGVVPPVRPPRAPLPNLPWAGSRQELVTLVRAYLPKSPAVAVGVLRQQRDLLVPVEEERLSRQAIEALAERVRAGDRPLESLKEIRATRYYAAGLGVEAERALCALEGWAEARFLIRGLTDLEGARRRGERNAMESHLAQLLEQMRDATELRDPPQEDPPGAESRGRAGLTFDYALDGFVVVRAFRGEPAYAAGIVAGDFLVAVEGVGTDRLVMDDVVAQVGGTVGARRTLTIRSADTGETRKVEFTLSAAGAEASKLLALLDPEGAAGRLAPYVAVDAALRAPAKGADARDALDRLIAVGHPGEPLAERLRRWQAAARLHRALRGDAGQVLAALEGLKKYSADVPFLRQLRQELAVTAMLEGRLKDARALLPEDGPKEHAALLLSDVKALLTGEGEVVTEAGRQALAADRLPAGLFALMPVGVKRPAAGKAASSAAGEVAKIERHWQAEALEAWRPFYERSAAAAEKPFDDLNALQKRLEVQEDAALTVRAVVGLLHGPLTGVEAAIARERALQRFDASAIARGLRPRGDAAGEADPPGARALRVGWAFLAARRALDPTAGATAALDVAAGLEAQNLWREVARLVRVP